MSRARLLFLVTWVRDWRRNYGMDSGRSDVRAIVKYEPITAAKRKGKSKIRLFSDGTRFLLVIAKICMLFSPLKIFLPLSGLLVGCCNPFPARYHNPHTTTPPATKSIIPAGGVAFVR